MVPRLGSVLSDRGCTTAVFPGLDDILRTFWNLSLILSTEPLVFSEDKFMGETHSMSFKRFSPCIISAVPRLRFSVGKILDGSSSFSGCTKSATTDIGLLPERASGDILIFSVMDGNEATWLELIF
jgi:hypothetical protein